MYQTVRSGSNPGGSRSRKENPLDDLATRALNLAQTKGATYADVRVVEIPGCGHSPYFEDAAAWNRAVGDFLA